MKKIEFLVLERKNIFQILVLGKKIFFWILDFQNFFWFQKTFFGFGKISFFIFILFFQNNYSKNYYLLERLPQLVEQLIPNKQVRGSNPLSFK